MNSKNTGELLIKAASPKRLSISHANELYRHPNAVSRAKADGLVHNNVRAVAEDGDGGIWIGTWGGPVRRVMDGKVTEEETFRFEALRRALSG